jgi:hypothetical protein
MMRKYRIDHLLLRLLYGRRWQKKIWASKADISDLQSELLVLTTPIISVECSITPIRIGIGNTPIFNPGILKNNDYGYVMTARSSSLMCLNDRYTKLDSDQFELNGRNINYILHLDDKFKVIRFAELDESLIRAKNPDFGVLQDIRLFYWNRQVWGVAAIEGGERTHQALFLVENDTVKTFHLMISPQNQRLEKNWAPLIQGDNLKLIYSIDPLSIVDVTSLEVEIKINSLIKSDHSYRGGTPLVKYGENYLGVIHSSPIDYKGSRVYRHYFITLTVDLKVLQISRPFFIEHKGIEIASGLVIEDDGILVAYGVGDRVSRLIKIPHIDLEKYLII